MTVIVVVAVGTLICGVYCDPQFESVEWTVVNNTAIPIGGFLNGVASGPILPPGGDGGFIRGAPDKAQQGETRYIFRALEFVLGEGLLAGPGGTGHMGKLVFCREYTWNEMEAMEFKIVVTQNIPGAVHYVEGEPCPVANEQG